ncbi:MAG: site-specific tyrosine recombinase XerD [Gammaproteobacteria bacterium]|nr:site-specific tyrosine recombinase XerD [Gammaproteobacteria bacterium]
MQSESKLLIETFIDSLWLEKNLSQNTLDSYKNDLNKFRSFVEKNEKSVLRADHLLILSYLSHLLDKGFSSKTISRNISSLKGFYKYLISTNQISSNPTTNIDAPKAGFFLPTTLTVEEAQKILDAPDETRHIELRDKAMLYTLYATGMRISELVGLGIHNVDLTRGSVQVMGKGGKERLIPLTDQAVEMIKLYLSDSRDKLSKGKDQTNIFVSTHGKQITRHSFWHRIKIYIERVEIKKDVHPHTLRHAFATHMLNNGADLRSVQLLLGHSDLATTQIYTHVAQDEVQSMHKKHHPRG